MLAILPEEFEFLPPFVPILRFPADVLVVPPIPTGVLDKLEEGWCVIGVD